MSLPIEKIRVNVKAIAASIAPGDKGKQVSITGRVVDHPHYAGEEITAILHFSPAAMARAVESLLHFDFQGDDITQLQDADEDKCEQLLPGIAEFQCEPDTYNGVTKLKVAWVNKAGGSGRGKFAFKEKLEGGDLRAFGAEMKSVFKNARGVAGTRKPVTTGRMANGSAQPPSPPAGPDDDIPF